MVAMPITQEMLDKLLAHLQRKQVARFPSCPLCHTSNWEPAGLIEAPFYTLVGSEAPEIQSARQLGRTITAPMLLMVCTNCYYTFMLPWNLIERDNQAAAIGALPGRQS
jgi:hypothetical protein